MAKRCRLDLCQSLHMPSSPTGFKWQIWKVGLQTLPFSTQSRVQTDTSMQSSEQHKNVASHTLHRKSSEPDNIHPEFIDNMKPSGLKRPEASFSSCMPRSQSYGGNTRKPRAKYSWNLAKKLKYLRAISL